MDATKGGASAMYLAHGLLPTEPLSDKFDLITAVNPHFKEGLLLVIAPGALLRVSLTGQLICCFNNEIGTTLLGWRF